MADGSSSAVNNHNSNPVVHHIRIDRVSDGDHLDHNHGAKPKSNRVTYTKSTQQGNHSTSSSSATVNTPPVIKSRIPNGIILPPLITELHSLRSRDMINPGNFNNNNGSIPNGILMSPVDENPRRPHVMPDVHVVTAYTNNLTIDVENHDDHHIPADDLLTTRGESSAVGSTEPMATSPDDTPVGFEINNESVTPTNSNMNITSSSTENTTNGNRTIVNADDGSTETSSSSTFSSRISNERNSDNSYELDSDNRIAPYVIWDQLYETFEAAKIDGIIPPDYSLNTELPLATTTHL